MKKQKQNTKQEVQDMETHSTKEDSLLEYRNTGNKYSTFQEID